MPNLQRIANHWPAVTTVSELTVCCWRNTYLLFISSACEWGPGGAFPSPRCLSVAAGESDSALCSEYHSLSLDLTWQNNGTQPMLSCCPMRQPLSRWAGISFSCLLLPLPGYLAVALTQWLQGDVLHPEEWQPEPGQQQQQLLVIFFSIPSVWCLSCSLLDMLLPCLQTSARPQLN